MKYYYDFYGWLSEELIQGRETEITPPEHGEKEPGKPYPIFTQKEWLLAIYMESRIDPQAESEPESEPQSQGNPILTPLEFINRLTDQEAKTIIALSKTNPDVELWWIKYNKASYINLEDPQTISGIQALEYMSVIGQGRAQEILSF